VGLFLPALDELFLYGITSKVTSDCLVDCLARWWEVVHDRFDHITVVNQAADRADTVLRLSIDAKATVKVGPCARGGKSRIPTVATDHDFHPEATVTPVAQVQGVVAA